MSKPDVTEVSFSDLPAGPESLREKLLDLVRERNIIGSSLAITDLPPANPRESLGLSGYLMVLPERNGC